MGTKHLFRLVVVCLAMVSPYAAALPLEQWRSYEARIFFKSYSDFANTNNPELIKLYHDGAVILANISHDASNPKLTKLSGETWKKFLIETFEKSRQPSEISSYHNAQAQGRGNFIEIRAERYVHNRCYWDRNFRLVIKKDEQNKYKITHQNIYLNHGNYCEESPDEKVKISNKVTITP